MHIVPVLASVLLLAACATQNTAPEKVATAPAAAAPAAKPGPQCYSGEHERFFNVDEKASIAGVAVTCKATADGKSGQWMGSKQ
jgi:hypothetical protein